MRDPWAQRRDETAAHYRQFLWWRDQSPRPPPSDTALAHYYDWSSRAAAWDALRELPEDTSGRARECVENMVTMLAVATRKHLERELASPEPTVEIKQISTALKNLTVIAAIVQPKAAGGVEQAYQEILDRDLTLEDLRALEKMTRPLLKE